MNGFRVEIDGGSWGNPGEAGAGIVLVHPSGQVEEHTVYLGKATNNMAEYAALLAALARLSELGAREITIITDSELLARQLTGQYRVRAAHLASLFRRVQALLSRFACWQILAVPREQNRRADALARQAIATRASSLPSPLTP